MITKFFKNRLSMTELLEKPVGFVHLLYNLAVKESSTDAGKNRLKNEALAEVLGG